MEALLKKSGFKGNVVYVFDCEDRVLGSRLDRTTKRVFLEKLRFRRDLHVHIA